MFLLTGSLTNCGPVVRIHHSKLRIFYMVWPILRWMTVDRIPIQHWCTSAETEGVEGANKQSQGFTKSPPSQPPFHYVFKPQPIKISKSSQRLISKKIVKIQGILGRPQFNTVRIKTSCGLHSSDVAKTTEARVGWLAVVLHSAAHKHVFPFPGGRRNSEFRWKFCVTSFLFSKLKAGVLFITLKA